MTGLELLKITAGFRPLVMEARPDFAHYDVASSDLDENLSRSNRAEVPSPGE